ncbi:MAG: type II secretion system protein [Candidatus Pacebacteria bacterium]|nr:type II secretion system protein [Candidatus Paceibacterota bacterium]MBP9840767.1 type II secretion system protein [Candidatus Paceibacterota bacterium]
MKKNKGFTLIELLVVIAIIALLSTVVLAALQNARAASRDAKRLSDLDSVTNALELYASANNGVYPAGSGTANPICGNNTFCLASQSTALAPYIGSIPADPSYANQAYNYRYCAANGNKQYTILVKLEKNTDWCILRTGSNVFVPSGTSCWMAANGVPNGRSFCN